VAAGTRTEVVMPQMGVSVSEGTVTRWLKQPGEAIALDEPLLEISTDKVDTEIPSPGEGVLAEILVQEGQTVDVGVVLAVIAAAGAAAAAVEATPVAPEPATPVAAPVEPPIPAPVVPPTAPSIQAEPVGIEGNGRSFVSPVVARIAAEHGVDPGHVPGTGTGGRVTKKDILAFIESGAPLPEAEPVAAVPVEAVAPVVPAPLVTEPAVAEPVVAEPVVEPVAAVAPVTPSPVPAAAPAAPTPAPAPVADTPPATGDTQPGETIEPMTAMRRGVAEHMRKSLDTSAHVTSAIEVDMSRIVAARDGLKQEYVKAYGVNPTYLSFIARATVDTLKDYPWVNAEIRGESIVSRQYVNLGIAVALADGKGLIVPVIKHAEGLNLLGMARAIADLAERARTKKLLPDDVQGGTFTITNPGGFGTFHGTPIISQPQVGILGTYALVKRPWVVQDELGHDVIAIRPMMNITLTYDHRLVDGAYSGQFLRDLREKLEGWDVSDY
jgi:pyruvate/2-oxoglutarate dehydrogenase complex dihydrolipoamide acyltransferase (E2) component